MKKRRLSFLTFVIIMLEVILLAFSASACADKNGADISENSSNNIEITENEKDSILEDENTKEDAQSTDKTEENETADDAETPDETPDEPETSDTSSNTDDKKDEPVINGMDYSTTQRPVSSDFDWFTTDVIINGLPVTAEIFTDLRGALGSWKGLMVYFLDDQYEDMAVELLNFDISGTEDQLWLTADWYSMEWIEGGTSELQSEENIDDVAFLGKWENGAIHITESENIDIHYFYMKDGKQYAIGNINTSGGFSGVVAMCRP